MTATQDQPDTDSTHSARTFSIAPPDTQTLSVLVENKPGVLTRVSALFARRGFNISSLAVGPTEHPEISRITVVVNVAEQPLEQIVHQLDKLVNVLRIVHLEPRRTVQRELVLVKVGADNATRTSVLEIVQMFRAKVVNAGAEAVTIEATGTEDKLIALLDMLEPFGIREIVKSGAVAISRGPGSLVDEVLED
ncbi:acetolactate synthase small subunit [Brachybacterium endophyticum]|uniref:Acetolactate synthase small subunit n=1 Tax=Brachybacterium endophyticum TaxID=2182385 RepID=A0A2U2RHT7_9MICO|nr:acetolactate synthase small subunit [Brachybacterium endophyticum]PWH05439.1 acetolactate synthase small subunit [Brachybacterium endophyticum]